MWVCFMFVVVACQAAAAVPVKGSVDTAAELKEDVAADEVAANVLV